MGIGPIPDIRALMPLEPIAPELEVSAVARVENSARAGANSSGRRQPASRDDGDNAQKAQESMAEESASATEDTPPNNIDFFA
jgi:hypothetical protein